jgi:diguanylate cyclase (GGDEF)-like protein
MLAQLEATKVLQAPEPAPAAAALWGTWFRRKISLALTLTALVPLLVLAYSLYASVMSWLGHEPLYGRDLLWSQALLVFTGILMAAGGFVIWDLGLTVRRTAETVAATGRIESAVAEKTDQIGVLMGSFSRMLGTIETQTGEINQFAVRLDVAYRELESTNTRLKEVTFKDEVTRLFNRRFFSIRIEEEVSRYRRFKHPVSVVLLDLDGFKAVNDELGHAVGDETLRGVGELLLKHSRGINVICRYGGDEFAILLVETPKAGAQIYADRIRHLLEYHVFPHGQRISASFGIASLPEDVGPVAEDLLRAADEALYAAKRAGKNRVSSHEAVAAPNGAAPPAMLVALPSISGASDGNGAWPPAAPPSRVAPLEALVGARSGVSAEDGAVVSGRADVGTALESLADTSYDFTLRPAAADPAVDRDPEDRWRSGEISLLPSGTRPLSQGERATLTALHGLIAARDLGTGAHSERVWIYAEAIARAYGILEADLRDIEHGVILHDIGKIGIPDSILLKPGPLSPEEWKVMRTHPGVGRGLIQSIPFLAGAVPIVYHHHERWDGNGYPEGLRGEGIPLSCRIFAVADALDAMTFDRPYSRAVSLEAAREEISRCGGTHFDPAVVSTFLSIPLEALQELKRRATS